MNDIPSRQNEKRQLDRLAAQRQLYSDAKNLQAIEMIMAAMPPALVVLSFVVSDDLEVYATLLGIVAAVLVLIAEGLRKDRQETAAKIQEAFDCDILEIVWNEVKVSERPAPETVARHAKRYLQSKAKKLPIENWYSPAVSRLPMYLGRLACQRSNCVWDKYLRKRVMGAIIIVLVILSILVLVLGLVNGLTLSNFILLVVAPLLPAYILGYHQIRDHRDAVDSLQKLLSHAMKYWREALAGTFDKSTVQQVSRRLQDEIYTNRRKSPLVFDWIYRSSWHQQEDSMNKGVAKLVDEMLLVSSSKQN